MIKFNSLGYLFLIILGINIYQNSDELKSGFPPTSGQIPPTSGDFDWPNWDPYMAYSGSIS